MLRKVEKGSNRCNSTQFSHWQSAPRMKAVGTPQPEALSVWKRDLRNVNIPCLRRRRSEWEHFVSHDVKIHVFNLIGSNSSEGFSHDTLTATKRTTFLLFLSASAVLQTVLPVSPGKCLWVQLCTLQHLHYAAQQLQRHGKTSQVWHLQKCTGVMLH